MRKEYLVLIGGIASIFLIFILIFSLDIFSKINFNLPQLPQTSQQIQTKKDEEKSKEPGKNSIQPVNLTKVENTFYSNFELNLNNEKIGEKNVIFLKKNEIVTITFKAEDKDYEIFIEGYNLNLKISKGETKILQFQTVNEGNFSLLCQNCKNKNLGDIIIKNE